MPSVTNNYYYYNNKRRLIGISISFFPCKIPLFSPLCRRYRLSNGRFHPWLLPPRFQLGISFMSRDPLGSFLHYIYLKGFICGRHSLGCTRNNSMQALYQTIPLIIWGVFVFSFFYFFVILIWLLFNDLVNAWSGVLIL